MLTGLSVLRRRSNLPGRGAGERTSRLIGLTVVTVVIALSAYLVLAAGDVAAQYTGVSRGAETEQAAGQNHQPVGGTATPTSCPLGWEVVASPNNPNAANILTAVGAVTANDIWTVGYSVSQSPVRFSTLTEHWDGTQWSIVPSPNPTGDVWDIYLKSVSARATNDVWAVGNYDNTLSAYWTVVLHWDGTQWSLIPSLPDANNVFYGVKAVGPNDVWAVGGAADQMLIAHWDGTSWSRITSPHPGSSSHLNAVNGASGNDLWAVGSYQDPLGTDKTLVVHWDGSQWVLVASPNAGTSPNRLYGVHAISSNDVWAVGQMNGFPIQTLTEHWDGSAWSIVPSPNPSSSSNVLMAVSGTVGNDVWAAGYSDYGSSTLLLHWDGQQWSQAASPAPGQLNGVAAISSTSAWAVGQSSQTNSQTVVEHFRPLCSQGTPTPLPTETQVEATSTPLPTETQVEATPTSTATICPTCFTDVPPGSTFYQWIECLAGRGIISGYPDRTFRPNNNVSRGQISKIVALSVGYNEGAGTQIYEDVSPGSPFEVYVNEMSRHGVMGGYPCGGSGTEPCVPPENRPYFRPSDVASRGALAKIVSNAAGYQDTPSGQTFEDVSPNHPYYLFVERLVARGAMGGYPCGGTGEPCNPPLNRPYFRPYNTVTRGQASKIVANTFFPGCNPQASK